MKKIGIFFAVIVFIIGFFTIIMGLNYNSNNSNYILEFKDSLKMKEFLFNNNAYYLTDNMLLVSANNEEIKKYQNNEDIIGITLDNVMEAQGYSIADNTNDASQNNNTSLEVGIDSVSIWNKLDSYLTEQSIEASKVKVAVLDTGINALHEDLVGRVTNGYDFINIKEIASEENSDDSSNSHGTKVSGIIAATCNNSIGISGMAGLFDVELMPIKVLDSNGIGDISTIIKGIDYAINNNADIINLSFSKYLNYKPLALESIIDKAVSKGILVLTAAGNHGADSVDNYYPASIRGANPVVSYEMKNGSSNKTEWSNDFSMDHNIYYYAYFAPAKYYTTSGTDSYEYFTGTSASAAYITGYAAALYSVFGSGENRNLAAVTKILENTIIFDSSQGYILSDKKITSETLALAKSEMNNKMSLDVDRIDKNNFEISLKLYDEIFKNNKSKIVFALVNEVYDSSTGTNTNEITILDEVVVGESLDYSIESNLSSYSNNHYVIALSLSKENEEEYNSNKITFIDNAIERVIDIDYAMYFDLNIESDYANILGSKIYLLDHEGNKYSSIENEHGLSSFDVDNKYGYLIKENENIKLGYSKKGYLYLPYSVFENDKANLVYVFGDSIYNVEVPKVEEYTVGGSNLHNITINTDLKNICLYLETPFGYKRIDINDPSKPSIYATNGSYKLVMASNDGYILSKEVTINDETTSIDFSEEKLNAVEIDITARTNLDTANGDLGYLVALGNDNNLENMVNTGIVTKDNKVYVTPGNYSLNCVLFKNNIDNGVRGFDIILETNKLIDKNMLYDFTLDSFKFQLTTLKESYELGEYVDYNMCGVYNGYIMQGYVEFPNESYYIDMEYSGEYNELYNYKSSKFTIVDDANLYDESEKPIDSIYYGSIYINNDMLGNSSNVYIVKYKLTNYASMFPELFTSDTMLTMEINTKSYHCLKLDYSSDYENIYSIDVCYINDDNEQITVPSTSNAGITIYLLGTDFKYDTDLLIIIETKYGIDYQFIKYTSENQNDIHTITSSKEYNALVFEFVDGENTYYNSSTYIIEEYNGKKYTIDTNINLNYFDENDYLSNKDNYKINVPYGTYDVIAECNNRDYDEEDGKEDTLIIYRDTIEVNEVFSKTTVNISELNKSKLYFNDNKYYRGFSSFEYSDGYRYTKFNNLTEYDINELSNSLIIYNGDLSFNGFFMLEKNNFDLLKKTYDYKNIELENGKTYTFSFDINDVVIDENLKFTKDDDVIINYNIIDGNNNIYNNFITYPIAITSDELGLLEINELPFDTSVSGINKYEPHYYPIYLYYREVNSLEYQKVKLNSYQQFNLGKLNNGSYEGYIEIDFDTYRDEFLLMYADKANISTNIGRIFSGKLTKNITFEVKDNITYTVTFISNVLLHLFQMEEAVLIPKK